MTRVVWRIAADTRQFSADDLSGGGAKATGGRWNAKGYAVVYTSASRALACLETLVHFNAGGLPLNRYLVEISIPEGVWASAQNETADTLPIGWDAEPASATSVTFGTDWIRRNTAALLIVPSVIVPEEFNILLNSGHADAERVTCKKVRKWLYDPRVLRKGRAGT